MNTLEVMSIKMSLRLNSYTPSALKTVQAWAPDGSVLNLIGDNYGLSDREVAVMQGVNEGYETGGLPEGSTLPVNNRLHGIFEKIEVCKQVHAVPPDSGVARHA